jgi:ParB-like nuclease domain
LELYFSFSEEKNMPDLLSAATFSSPTDPIRDAAPQINPDTDLETWSVESWPIKRARTLKIHWACNLFSKRSVGSFDTLVDQIRSSGQLEPITVANGMILDGRHRLKALTIIAKDDPSVQILVRDLGQISDEKMMEHIMAISVHARHWNDKDRALWAAKYYLECDANNISRPTVWQLASSMNLKSRTLEKYIADERLQRSSSTGSPSSNQTNTRTPVRRTSADKNAFPPKFKTLQNALGVLGLTSDEDGLEADIQSKCDEIINLIVEKRPEWKVAIYNTK